jgi:anti-sigma B factor antagonist
VNEPLARFDMVAAETTEPPVLVVSGEIDLANAEEFHTALADATVSGGLTVDLTEVTYVDSAAVRVLFAHATNTELVLRVPAREPIASLLRISGLDQALTVHVVG